MAIRTALLAAAAMGFALAGCREGARGPVVVSVVGEAPELANPNLTPIDPPSALLLGSTAQGLVRFDAAGQIEPALAQSWIVSDDGLRLTFRLRRARWANGRPVTAEQVVRRLRAAIGAASKNPLKPLLLAIDNIEAMTGNVLEISLKAPRPNLLQLLAQPELAIVRSDMGTGPYRAAAQPDRSVLLTPADEEDEGEEAEAPEDVSRDIVLRGEGAALAAARFRRGLADFVTGGTVGDLPIARAAPLRGDPIRFDPVNGLFGIAFVRTDGILESVEARRALSMAIDRPALTAALGVPGLVARETILPAGLEDVPAPTLPDWTATPLPARRAMAARMIAGLAEEVPVKLFMALPKGPGYRLVFAHLRRDWRAIGVALEAVEQTAHADLRLVDSVAAGNIPTWYLRRFSCPASPVCSPEADTAMDGARMAQDVGERRALLAAADRTLTDAVPFIPLTAPVRWSLVAPRLTGFQTNQFGRRFLGSLVAPRR